jgi:hypothetical protein
MRDLIFTFLMILGILVLPTPLSAQGMGVDYHQLPAENFIELKRLWQDLGEHFAELQDRKATAGNPNWQEIEKDLRYMQSTLREMRKVDSVNAYEKFTGQLGNDLSALQQSAKTQDANFFLKIGTLEQSCFKCHATHRSGRP